MRLVAAGMTRPGASPALTTHWPDSSGTREMSMSIEGDSCGPYTPVDVLPQMRGAINFTFENNYEFFVHVLRCLISYAEK